MKPAGLWRKRLMVLGLAFGLSLFLWQLWLGYEAVREHSASLSIQPIYLLAGFALSLLVYAIQMVAWTLTMRCLGTQLTFGQTLEGFQLSFLPRYVPGGVWGYLSRSQWLQQFHGVSYGSSLTGSALEAVTQALTAFATGMACLSVVLREARHPVVVIGVLGVCLVALLGVPYVAGAISGRLHWNFSLMASLHLWAGAVFAHTMLWAAYGASVLLICKGLVPTSSVTALQATAASSLSWLLGFVLVIIPSGLGVREWTLTTLLSRLGQIPSWQANLVALVSRFELLVAELVWLAVGLGFLAHLWARKAGRTRDLSSQDDS